MRISDWSSDVCSSDLSDNGDPIVKLPAGITVISGQPGQSRNLVPGGGEASSTPSDANCSSAVARGVSEIERVDDRGSAQADVPSTRNARTPIHCLRRNCFITRLPWARHLLHCFCCDAAERGATWAGGERSEEHKSELP